MDIKQRDKMLEKLAHSSEGKALEDYFNELINKLTDSRTYSKDDFEIEGKSSIKAAAVLEKIMRKLKILEKPEKSRESNPYI